MISEKEGFCPNQKIEKEIGNKRVKESDYYFKSKSS